MCLQQPAASHVTELQLNSALRRCSNVQLQALCCANAQVQTGNKADLQERIRHAHSQQSHMLHGWAGVSRVLPQGRPMLAYKHFDFGKGRHVHLPLPELDGQAITGIYSTGAKGIAIADALTAAKRATFNAYAAKMGLKQLTMSVAPAPIVSVPMCLAASRLRRNSSQILQT